MSGATPASRIFLVASWRSGFSLFLWLGLVLVVFFLFQCIKSLLLGLKEQGLQLLQLGGSSRDVQPLRHRRHRYRDPEIYTVNCPPVMPAPATRSDQRPSSSPPVLQPDLHYTLPNTPSLEPPPYSSLYAEGEDPPPYDSLYTTKDNQNNSTLPPV